MTDPRDRTDRFRQNARQPLLIAGAAGLLLALLLTAAWAGPEHGMTSLDLLTVWGGGLFLAFLVAAGVWAAWRRPVMLTIGPDGLHMPFGWRRPLAWHDIYRVRRMRQRAHWLHQRQWLKVDPAPGVLPDYCWPGPRSLELRWMRQGGVRIPLNGLDADPECMTASIERFRPVTRSTR